MSNIYEKIWKKCEVEKINYPTRANKVIELDYSEFASNIETKNLDFANKITSSLLDGNIYIFKKAFKKEFFEKIKLDCKNYFKNKPSSFHKMLEGCPDFHREIDFETGKKYSFKVCKHSYYFYNWNNDPINIFDETYDKWRKIKILMGYEPTKYEKNTPKNGVVDRIQVVQYPSKYGFLEPHSDPYKYQKFFISGYMSKKGKDFFDGGFYALNSNDEVIDVEKFIDVGDLGVGFATIIHGVAPVNVNSEPKSESIEDGRWFYSLYTNQSDEVKNRHTGYSVTEKVNVKNKNLFPSQY